MENHQKLYFDHDESSVSGKITNQFQESMAIEQGNQTAVEILEDPKVDTMHGAPPYLVRSEARNIEKWMGIPEPPPKSNTYVLISHAFGGPIFFRVWECIPFFGGGNVFSKQHVLPLPEACGQAILMAPPGKRSPQPSPPWHCDEN